MSHCDSCIGMRHGRAQLSISLHCLITSHMFTAFDRPTSALHQVFHAKQARTASNERFADMSGDPSRQHDDASDDIVNLDESWFDPNIDHERVNLALGKAPPSRGHSMIQSVKCRLKTASRVTGFCVSMLLPNASTSNVCYSINERVKG